MAVQKTPEGVEASVSRRGDDYKGMVCSNVSVEPTDNGGFIVRQSFRPKAEKPRKGDMCCGPSWVEPKTLTFKSIGEVASFLKDAFPVAAKK